MSLPVMKRCPFCFPPAGGRVETVYSKRSTGEGGYVVMCYDCDATGPACYEGESTTAFHGGNAQLAAITRWNDAARIEPSAPTPAEAEDVYLSATFRRVHGREWGVASDKQLAPGDTAFVTKTSGVVVPAKVGELVGHIEADKFFGGAPVWLYRILDARPDPPEADSDGE